MAGVSLVSADYYRHHLAALRYWFAQAQAAPENHRAAVAVKVRFAARCLMRSDCPDVTDGERAEAERLIDSSAGWLTRHQLDAGAVRRRLEAEVLGVLGKCRKCGAITAGSSECEECSRRFLARLEAMMNPPREPSPGFHATQANAASGQ